MFFGHFAEFKDLLILIGIKGDNGQVLLVLKLNYPAEMRL